MFDLRKVPRGLLELLRLRSDGKNPGGLEESIRLTIESRDFYASDLLVPASSAATVGALGGVGIANVLTLTRNLGLRALGAELTIGAAAATNVTISWNLTLPGAPLFAIPLGAQFFDALNVAANIRVGSGPFPFVLPAGSVLIAQATGTAAGADHSLNVRGLLENLAFDA